MFQAYLLEALSEFHQLETLTLEEPGRLPPFTRATFDAEWALLHEWHARCPTLRKCTLLSGLRWERPRSDPARWIPVNDGSLEHPGTFFGWFMESFVLTRESSVISAYLRVLPETGSGAISLIPSRPGTRCARKYAYT